MFEIFKKVRLTKQQISAIEKLEKDGFYRFLTVKQQLKAEKERSILYVANIKLNDREIKYCQMNLRNNYSNFYCRICGDDDKPCHHIVHLMNEIQNGKYPEVLYKAEDLEVEFQKLEKDYREKVYREQKALHVENLNSLVSSIEESEQLLISQLVEIMPVLKYTVIGNKTRYYLGLKVGIDKYYIIKSIQSFISLIDEKVVHKYGKGLEFKHILENFTKRSQQLLEIIRSLLFGFPNDNSRVLEISAGTFNRIIELYSGRQIEIVMDTKIERERYNDVITFECYVTNEAKELEIEITENEILKFKNINEAHYIATNTMDYIISNGLLYEVNVNEDLQPLSKFIGAVGEFDVKYVKEDFIKQIYTRYHKHLLTTEDFKKSHPIVEVKIESYFDMEDGNIILNTKYFYDDKEINISDIKDNIVFNKASKYHSLIENLGFDHNIMAEEKDIANFLRADLTELKKLSELFLSDDLRMVKVKTFNKAGTYLGYNSGMLNVCFEDLNYNDEELYVILSAIKKKKKYARLNKNTIIEIDDEIAMKFLKTVEEFDLDVKHLTKAQDKPLYQSLKLLGESDSFIDIKTDDVLKNMLTDIANYKSSDYLPANSLKEVMRDYQIDAFKWIKTLIKYNFCGILADDMGLGKTLEIISVILSDGEEKPSLIVCPKSLSYNWKNEFKKWASDIDVININGLSLERSQIIKEIDNHKKAVYISSYDSLRNDLDNYIKKKFRFVILDEAQFIKNHTTLKAKSVKQIASELRFVLTGTPIENTVVDLWSIFDFLMPNYLYNYSAFKNRYEKNITQYMDDETIGMLVKKITPFILRRTKEEVLKNLPEKIETIRYATMGPEQRKVYEAQLLMTKDLLLSKDKFMILQSLTRLRQISVNPSLFIDDYKGRSAKTDLAIELINDFVRDGHKILLFSQFTSAFDDIEKELQKLGIKYFILTGKTDALDRVEMAEAFNDETSAEKVFLVSLKAGGTGLNLIGADIVIHLDPWWNISAENQATDRAHRIGQARIVQVIKLVCEDSIEQKVIELQQLKQNVVDAVIANNDENIIKLSDADLKYLLS